MSKIAYLATLLTCGNAHIYFKKKTSRAVKKIHTDPPFWGAHRPLWVLGGNCPLDPPVVVGGV